MLKSQRHSLILAAYLPMAGCVCSSLVAMRWDETLVIAGPTQKARIDQLSGLTSFVVPRNGQFARD